MRVSSDRRVFPSVTNLFICFHHTQKRFRSEKKPASVSGNREYVSKGLKIENKASKEGVINKLLNRFEIFA